MEQGQEERDSHLLALLDDSGRHELGEIDAALRRLWDGGYGICENCRQAIPVGRLSALPTARRCIGCEQDHSQG